METKPSGEMPIQPSEEESGKERKNFSDYPIYNPFTDHRLKFGDQGGDLLFFDVLGTSRAIGGVNVPVEDVPDYIEFKIVETDFPDGTHGYLLYVIPDKKGWARQYSNAPMVRISDDPAKYPQP
jgi:hypothetical protein